MQELAKFDSYKQHPILLEEEHFRNMVLVHARKRYDETVKVDSGT